MAWRRFWTPENTDLLLDNDAYLPDPEEEYATIPESQHRGLRRALCENEMGALIDVGALPLCLDSLRFQFAPPVK